MLWFFRSPISSFSFAIMSHGVLVVRGKDPRARNEDRGDGAKSDRRVGIARGDALGERPRVGVSSNIPRRPVPGGLGRETGAVRIVRGVICICTTPTPKLG